MEHIRLPSQDAVNIFKFGIPRDKPEITIKSLTSINRTLQVISLCLIVGFNKNYPKHYPDTFYDCHVVLWIIKKAFSLLSESPVVLESGFTCIMPIKFLHEILLCVCVCINMYILISCISAYNFILL